MRFRLRDDCPLWFAVPRDSTNTRFCDFRQTRHGLEETSYNPQQATRAGLHLSGLGYSLFARHYSGSLG